MEQAKHQNLYAILKEGFPADGSTVAIETTTRTYCWDDLDHISSQLAYWLHSLGLPQGARVAVQVEKTPEALLLYLATLRAGLVYLPLNTAYSASEVDYFLGDAQPAVLVGASQHLHWLKPLAQAHQIEHVLTLEADGTGSLMEAAAELGTDFATVAVGGDDLAAILYTSGTTGRSKGAMLTHGNLSSNALTLKSYWGWQQDDVLLHMLPIFHIHGLFVACHGALIAGARMVWLPSFDAKQAIRYLPQCTVMMGVPTYYVRLLAQPEFNRDLCKNMRLFISGSAPLLADTFTAFEQRTGMTILERYGMSETVMNTSNPYDQTKTKRLAGTVGAALPGIEIRVVDDNDQTVEIGTPGHVQVRGPNVFRGYWKMPEKTQEEFTQDGWFRTGDIGVLGGESIPDTYLSIVGRSKDLIISGGYNVYPKEIELVIDELPGVRESAVIGVPHADFGEAVLAVIVPEEGAQLDLTAMLSTLKKQLANYKLPKKMDVISELPRNTMGKVQKNVLRDRYTNSFVS